MPSSAAALAAASTAAAVSAAALWEFEPLRRCFGARELPLSDSTTAELLEATSAGIARFVPSADRFERPVPDAYCTAGAAKRAAAAASAGAELSVAKMLLIGRGAWTRGLLRSCTP
jgi:hypothetical protein